MFEEWISYIMAKATIKKLKRVTKRILKRIGKRLLRASIRMIAMCFIYLFLRYLILGNLNISTYEYIVPIILALLSWRIVK